MTTMMFQMADLKGINGITIERLQTVLLKSVPGFHYVTHYQFFMFCNFISSILPANWDFMLKWFCYVDFPCYFLYLFCIFLCYHNAIPL